MLAVSEHIIFKRKIRKEYICDSLYYFGLKTKEKNQQCLFYMYNNNYL